ncbi:MAG: hypothetical protein OSB59_05305 [Candidatus Poseidoniia archaeon]|nr:hypothetical protein [Candidatus Poseidoniia archaeon]
MLVLLDGTNYLLEVYFWLILGAILLITLTIIFARPDPLDAKDNIEYDLKEGIATEETSYNDYNKNEELDDEEIIDKKVEETQEINVEKIKKQWALAFTIFGLAFITVGSIVLYLFEFAFTTFFGACMIYVGIMSIAKGVTFQLSDNGWVKKIIPIGIFFLNFGLLTGLLGVIEGRLWLPWIKLTELQRIGNIFLIFILPYLIWIAVPTFNKKNKETDKGYFSLVLLNNSLKFVVANFIILWILEFNFISLPLLRQFSKVGFDLSIDLLKITITIAILSLLKNDRRSLIKTIFMNRKANSNELEQEDEQ